MSAVILLVSAAAGAEQLPALDHDAALRLAAERNLSLLARRLERRRLELVAEGARRPYLPEVGAEAAVNEVVGQQRRTVELLPTITYAAPWGTAVRGDAAIIQGVDGSPERERAFTIEISQALLRGGPIGGGADLRQADIDVRIERELFRAELNALLVRADHAYWDLAFAQEDLDIKRRSRDRAKTQFEETTENIRRGLLAPGEIYVVEESLVDFEDRLSRAEEALALAESGLRRLIRATTAAPVRASSNVESAAVAAATEAESLNGAVTKNPSVLAARLSAQRAGIGIAVEQHQALPQLDVFGSVGLVTGVTATTTGTTTTKVPLPGDPELRAGVRVSFPLYWGPDKARVERARTEQAQRRLDVSDAEEVAIAAVREAAIRIRARRQRLDLAARIVDLSQKKLDVERDKYKSGLSTLADVVRFQRELDAALSGALQARVDLLRARTEMLAARGDLHDTLRVAVQ